VLYDFITDYAATVVFLCMVIAVIRRLVFKPARYAVPEKFGKAHTADAIFLLSLIAVLMVADSLFAAARAAAPVQAGHAIETLAAFSLPWMLQNVLGSVSLSTLGAVYFGAYLVHELTFYFLLCYRPFGIQFHVETSLFNIYFAKLDREILKPVRWGVAGRASRSSEIFWREDLRRFHLEAHPRFLFLRGLRAVFGQLPVQRGGQAVVAAFSDHQGARLQLQTLSGGGPRK
jgi:hypothetical protein